MATGISGSSCREGRPALNSYSPPGPSTLLHLFGLRLVLIFVIVVVLLVIARLRLRRLRVILLFLLRLLHLAQGLPLLRESVGLRKVICDDDVVEDGAALHLPQVEAHEAEVVVLVELVVILVLRVGDLLRLPEALVGRIRDPLPVPFPLECGIVLHGRFPFSVLFVVPIVWLFGVAINNALV